MPVSSQFLYTTCQIGAENALKREIADKYPDYRFAYSRPGFVTFKLPAERTPKADFRLESIFARSQGFSLGKVTGDSLEARAAEVVRLAEDRPFVALHVWPRDRFTPGHHGYTPGLNEESDAAQAAILAAWPTSDPRRGWLEQPLRERAGQLVLDCILIGPNEWWIGYHQTAGYVSRFPGGLQSLELPPHAVSRAYLKMREALAWAQFPFEQDQQAVEIGCAPGGASQALLEAGLLVTGIDPAVVDPRVANDPRFKHVRKRGADVQRREFRKTRWLTADMNVAPQYTLDTIEAIVTHPEVEIRGLLLTLKLLDWDLAAMLPEYLDRVRGWGYRDVRARQLQFNRQEICVAALHSGKKRPPRRVPANTGEITRETRERSQKGRGGASTEYTEGHGRRRGRSMGSGGVGE